MKDIHLPNCAQIAALPQTELYRHVLQAMGCEVLQIPLTNGTAQCILRSLGPLGKFVLLPNGPVWSASVTEQHQTHDLRTLWAQLRRKGIRCMVTNAASVKIGGALKQAGHIPIITGQCEARLDLSLGQTLRRQKMQPKWRNRLSRAENSGLRVAHRPFDTRRDQWLLEAEVNQRKVRRYYCHPIEFSNIAAAQSRHNTRIFQAIHKGTPVAAMLFLRHGDAATYFIGHANAQGRSLSAHNLLLWEASNWLAEHGHSRLDLGVIDTEAGAGLARFKLGSGAEPSPLGDTFVYTGPTAFIAKAIRTFTPHKATHVVAKQSDPSCR